MTTRCVSVVIAARHPVVLCGLMTMLRAEDDFNVVASCQDGETCIEAIRDLAPNLNHEFEPQILCLLEKIFVLGAKNDLHKSGAVAQVAENDPAVVPTAMDPAAKSRGLTDVIFAQIPAVNRSFHWIDGLYNMPLL